MRTKNIERIAYIKPGTYRSYTENGKLNRIIGTKEALDRFGYEFGNIVFIKELDNDAFSEARTTAEALARESDSVSESDITSALRLMLDAICNIEVYGYKDGRPLKEEYEKYPDHKLPEESYATHLPLLMAIFIQELTLKNTLTTITPLMEFFSRDILLLFRKFPTGPLASILYKFLNKALHGSYTNDAFPDAEFWNAPPDKWNYLSESEPDFVGIAVNEENAAGKIYDTVRTPDPLNLSVYYARLYKKLRPEIKGDYAEKLIDSFKTYSMAIHRVTDLFDDTLSVKVEAQGWEKIVTIPETAEAITVKDAGEMLKSIDLELSESLAYVVLKALAEVSSRKEAYELSQKRKEILFRFPYPSAWYDSSQERPYKFRKYTIKRGLIFGAIISAIIAAIWLPTVYSEDFRSILKILGIFAGLCGLGALYYFISSGSTGGSSYHSTRSGGSSYRTSGGYWDGFSDGWSIRK